MALVPPGKTLKAQASNTLLKFKYRIAKLSDEEKYKQCEIQLRTVQVSLVEWRALLRPPLLDTLVEKFNLAAQQNNHFMADLKKCKAAKYADAGKTLEEIFEWRMALSQQSASLKVPGPKYDLSDVVESSDPLVTIALVRIPPPPAPAPARPNNPASSNASAPLAVHAVPMSAEYARVADSNEWYPQQALTPSPSRTTTYRAGRPVDASDTISMSGVSSMHGGLSGAQGSWPPGGGRSASGVGAFDSGSTKSFSTLAFGPGSEQGHGSFSSGSGGGHRTSTDSSASSRSFHSASQSLDPHAAGGHALPPSGMPILRSGLQGPSPLSSASDISKAMGLMQISSPIHGGPPPAQMAAGSASRLTHPGQQHRGPILMTHAAQAVQPIHGGGPAAGLRQPHAGAPRPHLPQPSTIPAAPPAVALPGMVNHLSQMQHSQTQTQAGQSSQAQAGQSSQAQASARRFAPPENNVNSRAPRA